MNRTGQEHNMLVGQEKIVSGILEVVPPSRPQTEELGRVVLVRHMSSYVKPGQVQPVTQD